MALQLHLQRNAFGITVLSNLSKTHGNLHSEASMFTTHWYPIPWCTYATDQTSW